MDILNQFKNVTIKNNITGIALLIVSFINICLILIFRVHEKFIDSVYRRKEQIVANVFTMQLFNDAVASSDAPLYELNQFLSRLIVLYLDFVNKCHILLYCLIVFLGFVFSSSNYNKPKRMGEMEMSVEPQIDNVNNQYKKIRVISSAFILFATVVFLSGMRLYGTVFCINKDFVESRFYKNINQFPGKTVLKVGEMSWRVNNLMPYYITGDILPGEDPEDKNPANIKLFAKKKNVSLLSSSFRLIIFFVTLTATLAALLISNSFGVAKDNNYAWGHIISIIVFMSILYIVVFNKDLYSMCLSAFWVFYNTVAYSIRQSNDEYAPYINKNLSIHVKIKNLNLLNGFINNVISEPDETFDVEMNSVDFPNYFIGKKSFKLDPIKIKYMLVGALREGNVEDVLKIANILDRDGSSASRAFVIELKSYVNKSKQLLKNVDLIIDPSNGYIAHAFEVIRGYEIADNGSILRRVLKKGAVDKILQEWLKLPGARRLHPMLVKLCTPETIYYRETGQQLTEEIYKKYAVELSRKSNEAQKLPKDTYVLIYLDGYIDDIDVSDIRALGGVGTGVDVVNVSGDYMDGKNNDAQNVKPQVRSSGKVRVLGENASGKTFFMRTAFGKMQSSISTVPLASVYSVVSDAAKNTGRTDVSVPYEPTVYSPLYHCNKHEYNMLLNMMSVGDSSKLPGFSYGESMKSGLFSYMEYAKESMRRIRNDLLPRASSADSTRLVREVILTLGSMRNFMQVDGRDAELVKKIDNLILDICAKNSCAGMEKRVEDLDNFIDKCNREHSVKLYQVWREVCSVFERLLGLSGRKYSDPVEGSTGEQMKMVYLQTLSNRFANNIFSSNTPRSGQAILVKDETRANMDPESSRMISYLESLLRGTFQFEIDHNPREEDMFNILMYFDTKFKTILFYYMKDGRWHSDTEFISIYDNDVKVRVHYLDGGSELAVVKIDGRVELTPEYVKELVNKLVADGLISDLKNMTPLDKFMRYISVEKDPSKVILAFNGLDFDMKSQVVNRMDPERLVELMGWIGYDIQDGVDNPILQLLSSERLVIVKEVILRVSDPDAYNLYMIAKKAREEAEERERTEEQRLIEEKEKQRLIEEQKTNIDFNDTQRESEDLGANEKVDGFLSIVS